MLEVHPPHHSISGWRDFLLHLLTITIGLLIALTPGGLARRSAYAGILCDGQVNFRIARFDNLS